MTFPYNLGSEYPLPATNQALGASSASSVNPDIMFQEPSSSLPYPNLDHPFPTFTPDPSTWTTLGPNNYYHSSLRATTQHQQSTPMVGGWTGDSITLDVSANVPIAANATGMNHGNSSVIYQTEPSQLSRRVSTEQKSDIVKEINGDAFYRKSPTRSTKHVSIIPLYE